MWRRRAWKRCSGIREARGVTSAFPREEAYGLTAQMRRAAVSAPSNIAEGAARISRKEFLQFLSVGRGSLSELETQVVIASELGYSPLTPHASRLTPHELRSELRDEKTGKQKRAFCPPEGSLARGKPMNLCSVPECFAEASPPWRRVAKCGTKWSEYSGVERDPGENL